MERTPVESTIIASVGYDGDASALEIEFHRGRVYRYHDVPASVAAWLMQVPEKGAFFNRKIRDHYTYRDITPPDDDTPLIDQLRASLEQSGAIAERDPTSR